MRLKCGLMELLLACLYAKVDRASTKQSAKCTQAAILLTQRIRVCLQSKLYKGECRHEGKSTL